jgi:hypothetical protein
MGQAAEARTTTSWREGTASPGIAPTSEDVNACPPGARHFALDQGTTSGEVPSSRTGCGGEVVVGTGSRPRRRFRRLTARLPSRKGHS